MTGLTHMTHFSSVGLYSAPCTEMKRNFKTQRHRPKVRHLRHASSSGWSRRGVSYAIGCRMVNSGPNRLEY